MGITGRAPAPASLLQILHRIISPTSDLESHAGWPTSLNLWKTPESESHCLQALAGTLQASMSLTDTYWS